MRHTLSREYLHQKWNIEQKTQKEIARENNLTKKQINYLIRRKYKIPCLNNNKQKYDYNHSFFDVWSSDMAYILAFTICDGYIVKFNNKKYTMLGYDLHGSDVEILNYIKSCICPEMTIRFRNRLDKRTNKKYYQCNLRFTSKHIIQSLKKFGVVERKTGKEILPNIPKIYIPDFLRGILDGDGNIYIGKIITNKKVYKRFRLQFSSASKSFLENLKNKYLFGFGSITGPIGNCYVLEISARREIIYILNYIYNNNFCLNRKFLKYQEILEYENQMKTNKISQGTCKKI